MLPVHVRQLHTPGNLTGLSFCSLFDAVLPSLWFLPAEGKLVPMAKFTRGFTGRRAGRDTRLPPGQYDTGSIWPVLTAEATPRLDTTTWTFAVEGLVDTPTTWTWDEIHALPGSTYEGDIHCVTTWSKFGMTFAGVSVDTLLAIAGPSPAATHVLAWCTPATPPTCRSRT